jgi:hypothetical protein
MFQSLKKMNKKSIAVLCLGLNFFILNQGIARDSVDTEILGKYLEVIMNCTYGDTDGDVGSDIIDIGKDTQVVLRLDPMQLASPSKMLSTPSLKEVPKRLRPSVSLVRNLEDLSKVDLVLQTNKQLKNALPIEASLEFYHNKGKNNYVHLVQDILSLNHSFIFSGRVATSPLNFRDRVDYTCQFQRLMTYRVPPIRE